jgi:hypothetical protein
VDDKSLLSFTAFQVFMPGIRNIPQLILFDGAKYCLMFVDAEKVVKEENNNTIIYVRLLRPLLLDVVVINIWV